MWLQLGFPKVDWFTPASDNTYIGIFNNECNKIK